MAGSVTGELSPQENSVRRYLLPLENSILVKSVQLDCHGHPVMFLECCGSDEGFICSYAWIVFEKNHFNLFTTVLSLFAQVLRQQFVVGTIIRDL